MSLISVFISYAHEGEAHKTSVLRLAQRLRSDGIDCRLDQYEMMPAVGWPRWMLGMIESSQFVLIVCTPKYHRRFRGEEQGGAQWEGAIITQALYEQHGRNAKFIPVGFQAHERNPDIPSLLRSWTYYDLATDKGYEGLYRLLTGQPRIRPVTLGEAKQLPSDPEHHGIDRPLDLTRDKPRVAPSPSVHFDDLLSSDDK